jgi:hypothetical protein
LAAAYHLKLAVEALRRIGGMGDRADELHARLLDYERRGRVRWRPTLWEQTSRIVLGRLRPTPPAVPPWTGIDRFTKKATEPKCRHKRHHRHASEEAAYLSRFLREGRLAIRGDFERGSPR